MQCRGFLLTGRGSSGPPSAHLPWSLIRLLIHTPRSLLRFLCTGALKPSLPQSAWVSWGWRDGSAVKSTGCSSRGPGFNSQY
ncbi:hypothetical protein LEMLEM_LOCUS18793, partial [Lemmus lemmus]